MKKFVLLFCCSAAVTLAAAVPDGTWSIVISGKGSIPEKSFDKTAAQLLKRGLKHLTGADLKIVTGTPKTKNAIFVGRHADPLKFENRLWQGRFRTDNKGNWYFAGSMRSHAHARNSTNHRLHEAGIIRCAALFLREYAGFRAVLPSPRYYYFTKKKSIDFPKNFVLNYTTPDIAYCNGRNTPDPVYDLSNGFLPGVWYFTYGGHSHPAAVPPSLFKKHPEYFLLTSKNKRYGGKQYCISNPGFQELVYKEMCRKADAGYQWVQLAQTDGFALCRCKNCQEYGNTKDAGEKIWQIHRKLAERFHKERPGKKVVIICYHPNVNPPESFREFPPNVLIELSRYTPQIFADWKNHKVPGGFVTYVYNWGLYHPAGWSPKFLPEEGIQQIRSFRLNKVRGIYRCGFGELLGLEGPSYYAYGVALMDPAVTAEKAMEEFCRGALPQAPEALKKFYKKLYSIIGRKVIPQHKDWHRIHGTRMPGGNQIHYFYARQYDAKSLAELDQLLKKCEAASPGNSFPLLLRREFDNIRFTAEMSRAYLKHLEAPGPASFRALDKAVSARRAYLDSLPLHRSKKRYSWTAGVPLFAQNAPGVLLQGGSWRGRIVYPVTWPWEKMRARGIIPGARTVKTDGKEHFLLPALMEKWELDAQFSVKKEAEGLLMTLKGPLPQKGGADFFSVYLPGFHTVFRCKGAVGSSRSILVYRPQPDQKTETGIKYTCLKDEKEVIAKRIDSRTFTLFIPWKYFPGKVMPGAGKKLECNVTFHRKISNRFIYLAFEPDLKYLSERHTWAAGRGKLLF